QRAQRLYAIWGKLPDTPLTEADFLTAILRALDRGPGHEADASALAYLLTSSEAVRASRNGSGELVYTKAETFPSWPEYTIGTPTYDTQPRELAEEQQRQFDREAEEAFRNSPQNRQREEMVALVRQVANEVIDARIAELRRTFETKAVTEARRHLREGVA